MEILVLDGSIYYYSDERIKTEIEEVPDSLALSQINNILNQNIITIAIH